MTRFGPFAPAIVVLLGAIIVAYGSFWAAIRQSRFNADIRSANEKINRMQQDNIETLKGANTFSLIAGLEKNSERRLVPRNKNNLPVYDVILFITTDINLPTNTEEKIITLSAYINNPKKYVIGTISPGFEALDVPIEPGYYSINIQTRYANLTEILRFGEVNGVLGQS